MTALTRAPGRIPVRPCLLCGGNHSISKCPRGPEIQRAIPEATEDLRLFLGIALVYGWHLQDCPAYSDDRQKCSCEWQANRKDMLALVAELKAAWR